MESQEEMQEPTLPGKPLRNQYMMAVLLSLAACLVVTLLAGEIAFSPFGQEYPELARSFLSGRLDLSLDAYRDLNMDDGAPYGGRMYLPFGPLPALLYVPLVLLTDGIIPQYVVGIPLAAAAFLLMAAFGGAIGMRGRGRWWLAFAYVFASVFLPMTTGMIACWMSQLTANVAILAALLLYIQKRPPWQVGLAVGAAILCRPFAPVGLLAFIGLDVLLRRTDVKDRLKFLVLMAVPAAVAGSIFLAYNAARFDDPLEWGYRYQWEELGRDKEMTEGAVNPRYIPKNLAMLLFHPPYLISKPPFVYPSMQGLGFIFTSPFVFYLIWAGWRRRQIRLAALGICVGMLLPLMLYQNPKTGTNMQLGYRYTMDVLPLLFLLLAYAWKERLAWHAKSIVAVTAGFQLIWTKHFYLAVMSWIAMSQ